jgi:hypothetical protein
MKLGTRWAAGDEPPDSIPDSLRALIGDLERERDAISSGWSWTLTWLEGRPVVELDDGTRIVGGDDEAVVVTPEDEDEGDGW